MRAEICVAERGVQCPYRSCKANRLQQGGTCANHELADTSSMCGPKDMHTCASLHAFTACVFFLKCCIQSGDFTHIHSRSRVRMDQILYTCTYTHSQTTGRDAAWGWDTEKAKERAQNYQWDGTNMFFSRGVYVCASYSCHRPSSILNFLSA
jgi:hypothetical protein